MQTNPLVIMVSPFGFGSITVLLNAHGAYQGQQFLLLDNTALAANASIQQVLRFSSTLQSGPVFNVMTYAVQKN